MDAQLEHLKRMRGLLASGWTQGALARDRNGHEVSETSDNAVSFCIAGAMYRSARGLIRLWSIHHALREVNADEIASWNDARNRTQSEVLALIDRAIEIAEAE